jgi:ParB family chromosome partitioning protein
MSALPTETKRPGSERRALGKGLDSLLPRVTVTAAPGNEAETGRPLEIAIGQIDRNPFQTRTNFDEKQMEELTNSVSANGVIQPILVRPLPNGRFQLIAGERRWLASQRASRLTVPAYVRQVSDEQAMEITIIENLQRADLNPIEQARAYERLGREFGMTQEQMAARTGKDRASVANFLRLLRLPESVQDKVASGALSFGHARALVALPSAAEQEAATKRIIALSLSVRQAETYVQGILHPDRPTKKAEKEEQPIDPNVREVQDRLQRALGLRVKIEDHNGHGRVIIEYGHLEDFDALLERIVE